MKLKEKLLTWWNSENCSLKNPKFLLFSLLAIIGIGLATFFTGGLFLLASLLVIPIFAYIVEKKSTLEKEKTTEKANEYQPIHTTLQTFSDEPTQTEENNDHFQNVVVQSVDNLSEESSMITSITNKNAATYDPVHTYKKAILLLHWFFPSSEKQPHLQELINETIENKKQAFPELDKIGIFDNTVQDWQMKATDQQQFLLKKELRIYHSDKHASLPDSIAFNGLSIIKSTLIQLYSNVQVFIYQVCIEKTSPVNEKININDYDERLERLVRETREFLVELDQMLTKAREETQKAAESAQQAAESAQKARESRKAEAKKTKEVYEKMYLPALKQFIISKNIQKLNSLSQNIPKDFIGGIKDLISNQDYIGLRLTSTEVNWLLENHFISNEDLPKAMQKKTISSYIKNFLLPSNNKVTSVNFSPSQNQPEANFLRTNS